MNLRDPRHLTAAVVAVALVVSAAAWFLVVSGKRAESTELETKVAVARAELVAAQAKDREVKGIAGIAPTPLLKKAMPDDAATSDVLRELGAITRASGVKFVSITPQPEVAVEGFAVRPFDTVFEGNFAQISKFLKGLKELVVFEDGRLSAAGRLYTVDSIDFAEGERKFPFLNATVKVNAYMFGTGTVATPAATATATPAPAS